MGETVDKSFRYPGVIPFKKEQENIFFGRDHDIENLYQSVFQNKCTVIFGKSGIGKSYVINAGLLPKIDKKNESNEENYHYTALPFALETYDETKTENPLLTSLNTIINFDPGSETASDEFLNRLTSQTKQSLWFKLKV